VSNPKNTGGTARPVSGVTDEDVRQAYRMLLGREPENAEVVARHRAASPDLATLRRRFLSSPEFVRNSYQELVTPTLRRGFGFLPVAMDIEVTPDQLARLFAHVQRVWSQLGLDRPHYSVLSDNRFRPDRMGENAETFRRTGLPEVEELMRRLVALGVSPADHPVCLEYGCGVGRVTVPLSTRFAEVIGLDISQPHLDLARDFIAGEGRQNVTLQRVADLARLDVPAHDFLYSRIVLQHNPPPLIAHILRRVLSAMREGGVAVFQLVTHIEGYGFEVEKYLAGLHAIDDQELHAFRQDAVFAILHELGFRPLHVMRDHSVSGLDRISMQFIARRVTDRG